MFSGPKHPWNTYYVGKCKLWHSYRCDVLSTMPTATIRVRIAAMKFVAAMIPEPKILASNPPFFRPLTCCSFNSAKVHSPALTNDCK